MEHQKILSETWSTSKVRNNLILQFNYFLNRQSHFFSFNENGLEELITRLDNLVLVKDCPYWLTLVRINELVLLCAENYANNGELALVEDLLSNPRVVLVHVNGSPKPIVKKRHLALSEQFRGVAESPQDFLEWLQKETSLETKVEALLPHLFQKLVGSGFFHQEFLESLNERKVKIFELTGFLSDRGLKDSLDLFYWSQRADLTDRALWEAKQCPCSLDLFFELGRQVNGLAKGSSTSLRSEQTESENIDHETGAPRIGPSSLGLQI